jgi:hypothetical protein
MQKIITYNLDTKISRDSDFHTFFSKTRRDANFAGVFLLDDGSYLAIRDHLGTVPLYYRTGAEQTIRWSFCYNDLVEERILFQHKR